MDSNFISVWERVRAANHEDGKKPLSPAAEKQAPVNIKSMLENFIEDEAKDSGFYEALAAKTTQPNIKRVFMQLAKAEKQHALKLQTACFLLTGNSCAVKKPPSEAPRSMLEALRLRYSKENEGSQAYSRAAEQTDKPELKQLFSELAAEEKKHGAEIKRLVEYSLR
jgi:rubrerythrin